MFTGAWPYAVPFAWPVVASRCDSLFHCARSCQPQCLQYLLSGPVEERFADPSWGAVILSPGHMSGPRDVRRSPHLCLPRPKVLTQSFRRGPGHWPCSRLPTRGPPEASAESQGQAGHLCVCVLLLAVLVCVRADAHSLRAVVSTSDVCATWGGFQTGS